ncbi:Oxygen-evolving enhancer protein 3-1 [Hibiscus syriacus]|uniref:Oxygen-evolving enhancer protein 3-1 n=1 Tax=Hibiscus syriacus TaxID=106335 RepID=A0A6A2YD39_HIBSY|nr:Oxygen-evolving enhancer protein 3-1 [Hibiscus syriacus]
MTRPSSATCLATIGSDHTRLIQGTRWQISGIDGWFTWLLTGYARRQPPSRLPYPRLNTAGNNRVAVARPGFTVRAQQAPAETETGRRDMMGLVAAGLATGSFAQAVLADARSIKVGPPPPPSGGLHLKTFISSKPKDEKKSLNELTKKLFNTIDGLDHAAKIKSTPEVEKYYAETASALNDVIDKLG